jgi:hypothetical protein
MVIKIIPHDDGTAPVGKLADAEVTFTEGPFRGMKLIGFSVWSKRSAPGAAANVTFPSRQYSVNGERRSFALLRPDIDVDPDLKAQNHVRDLILAAYAAHENGATAPVVAEELVL